MIMLRRALAAFFVLHGFAHVPGFLSSWQLAEFEDVPYSTLILNGTVDGGEVGIRIVGVLWLVAAAAVIAAALVVWEGRAHALRTAARVAGFSLAMCAVGLPAAIVGLVIDVAILVGLAAVAVFRPAALSPALR